MLNSDVKKRIDDIHDLLVGQLPLPSERLELITVALIYKFMEDMDERAKKIGGKQSFFIKSLTKYSWSSILDYKPKGNENAAAKLVENFSNGIRNIAKAEHIPDFFRSIFNNISLRITNGKILKSFMDDISKFEYTHSEELGNAFEYLLKNFGNQKENGQFRTPRNLIHFIVTVVDPQKNDTILDPACGTGGFLIEAATHIKKQNTSPQYQKDPNKWGDLLKSWRGKLSENIQGYDNTPLMVRLSKVNMFLHQLTDPQIHEYDTISSYGRWNDKFDVILANPPFMTPKGGIKAHDKFKLQAKKAEVLFSDYILEHLKPGGRAGIIVPEGIIANSSNNDFVELRQWALKEIGLWAVVSMPAKIFEPYSGVKTSILFIDRSLAKNRKDIILLKVENDGFSLNKNRTEIKENNLPEAEEILQLFKEGKSLAGKQWKVKFNIVPKEDFDKLDAYRATTTAWKICKRAWERLDKTIVDLNVKLFENSDKRSSYEEQLIRAVDIFKEDTGIQFQTPKPGKDEFANPVTKDELKVWFGEQVKEEAIKFGNLEPTKKLSQTIVEALIDQRHYNLSFDRKDINDNATSNYPILKLGEITEVLDSIRKPISSVDRVKGPYPYYGAMGIVDYVKDYLFDERLLLVAEDGGKWEEGARKTFIAEGKYWVNNHAHVLRINKDIAIDTYVMQFLNQMDFSHFITGAVVPKLTQANLRNIEIPIPPIEKQQEMVIELVSYQKIIDGCISVIENFVPALPPNEGWEIVRMEEVCTMVRGPFGGSLKKEIFVESGYKVYEQSHAIQNTFTIGRYYITPEKFREMKRFALLPGDLIMSCSGVTLGRIAVCPEGAEEGIINQALLKLTPKKEVIRPMFLKLIMDSPHFQAQLLRGATGVAIPNVAGVDEIKGFEIPLPSLDEQDAAINLNDRFPVLRESNKYYNESYEYLGVRSASNSAYISVHLKKIIDNLSNSAKKLGKLPNIKLLFEKLELSPVIGLSYKPGRRFILKEENQNNIHNIIKSRKAFTDYYATVIKETRSKRLDERRLSKYGKILNDQEAIGKAVEFLQNISQRFNQRYLYKVRLNYTIDFTKPETLQEFAGDADVLRTLRDLEIFSVNDIDIRKQKTNFSASKASSGEYHLLTSFLGIISKIEPNSIVLIDEPEISLHPNWQMQYIEVLDKVFENYDNCHFIIASHSHFLVSDLKDFNSAILTLFFDEKERLIRSKLLDKDTFGWTPENILYNIFNVASVSNHYFEMDLRKLVRLISEGSEDYKQIKSYIDKFELFERVPEDPLNIVINQAKGYLQEHGV